MRLLFLAGLSGATGCAAQWAPAQDGSAGTNAPEVYLTAPSFGSTWETEVEVLIEAVVTDDADAAETLTVEIRSDIDGVVGVPLVDDDGEIEAAVTLSPGTHTITVAAIDADGMEGTDTTTIRVLDPGAPSQPAVRVEPTEPVTGDALLASVVVPSIDPEGDPVVYAYDWSVDGAPSGVTTADVSGLLVRDGQTWTVSVWATDGVTRSAVATRTVIVGNAAPDAGTVAITPAAPALGSELTCAHGPVTDAEGDAFTSGYAWYVDGIATPATAPTFDTGGLTRGATVQCALVVDDGTVTEHRSESVVLGNSAPTLAGAAVSPAVATASDTLRCIPSGVNDVDGDAVTLSYTWWVDGVEVATGPTLAAPAFGRGDDVTCSIVASDPYASADAVVAAGAEILNSAPAAPTVSFVQDTVLPGTMAECAVVTASTDPDGDSVSYRWSWTVDGAATADASARFDTSELAVGQVLGCTALPDDGFDVGAPASAEIALSGPTSGDIGPSDAYATIVGTVASGGFGKAVDVVDDLDGDGIHELIVSAPRGDGSTKGAAYVFLGSTLAAGGAFTDADAAWVFYGRASNDFLGGARGVAGGGDLDGDGLGDVILAAPFEDTGGSEAGMVYVLYGGSAWVSGSDALAVAEARMYGESGDWLGARISSGDLDGDGLDDLALSAPYNDYAGSKAGAVGIYFGTGARLSGAYGLGDADAVVTGAVAGTELGWSLDVMGDVDGDGYNDLGVGIFYDDTNATDAGSAALVSGADLSGQFSYEDRAFLIVRGTDPSGRFGYDVSGVGDVDADGLEDVAFGAYLSDTYAADAGEVRLFYGVTGLNREVDADEADADFSSTEASAQYGSLIAPLGDFDGDGLADWMTTAPRSALGGASGAGAAYVYAGRSQSTWGSTSASADVRILNGTSDDWFGDEGAGGFDINADGYSDIAIGAQQADGGAAGGGAVWLFTGP